VRGRVVSFRPSARILLPARRPPRPGALIRLDERRILRRRPGPSSRSEGFFVGLRPTRLLPLFVVKLILRWSTTPTRRLDVKHEPETITDAGILTPCDEITRSAAAEDRS
jgi:hypothetical protein